MIRRVGFLGVGGAAWALLVASCASVVTFGTTGTTSSTVSTSTTMSSGGGSGGGAVGTGGNGGAPGSGGQGDGGAVVDGGVCVPVTTPAEPSPASLILLVDQSGSLGGTSWTEITSAITKFVNDPSPAGFELGMNYFPSHDGVPGSCDSSLYSALAVSIGALPGNAQALIQSLPSNAFGPLAQLRPALEGALLAATAYAEAHATHTVAVVVISDSEPFGCGPNPVQALVSRAGGALGYDSVRTYMLALDGSAVASFDLIAAAGGTGAAIFAEPSSGLSKVRADLLGCDFALPEGPQALAQVNVSFIPGGQGKPIALPHATSELDCAGKPGWYYHNSGDAAPRAFRLCPASCTVAKAKVGTQALVSVGCPTVEN